MEVVGILSPEIKHYYLSRIKQLIYTLLCQWNNGNCFLGSYAMIIKKERGGGYTNLYIECIDWISYKNTNTIYSLVFAMYLTITSLVFECMFLIKEETKLDLKWKYPCKNFKKYFCIFFRFKTFCIFFSLKTIRFFLRIS